jgi:xylulokinase
MPATPDGAVVIGIDIGTSAIKAVMIGPEGGTLDRFAAPHETARPGPGAAEQDPAGWIAQVTAALGRFARHPAAARVAAIGLTSQVNTHVFCDGALAPLCPAIVWQDTRAAAAGAALEARIDPAAKIAALGAPIPIDASHALARMAWMAEHAPGVWDRTRHVLLPKDFVLARLTGAIGADPISAVGLVGPDLRYADAVVGLVARAGRVLAPLADPLAIGGVVVAGLPFAGVPVAVGTMDAWASMFGLGVGAEGQAFHLSGTSEVLGAISAQGGGAAGVISFAPWRGIRLHAAPTQAGGASLAWLGRLLGRGVAELGTLAGGAPITERSPLFLPHLEGERAPLWDARSRGGFAGLGTADGPAELARAVMEGVAFSARLALEAVADAAGIATPALRHGGGGAASDAWCRIRADAMGRRLERVAAPETGATGAAAMAAVAAGLAPDIATATARLVQTDALFVPDQAAAALADRRFALYRDLYEGLKPVHRALVTG